MQMGSPALVAAADVVPQDVLMVDNDNKTFLFLRLQGLAAVEKREEEKIIKMFLNIQKKRKNLWISFFWIALIKRKTTHEKALT